MDILLRGGRHRPSPFQHYPNSKRLLLSAQVDICENLRQVQQDQKGIHENGECVISITAIILYAPSFLYWYYPIVATDYRL